MNLSSITGQVALTAAEAATYIHTQSTLLKDSDILSKGLHNLVTHVDKTAEHMIIERLKELLPGAGVIAEESGGHPVKGGLNWIIDPLDGTTNFVHGIPVYSVSIALTKGDELLVGVVYDVRQKDCFTAWKDGGAYLNGEAIHVSHTNNLDDALLATGFPYYDFSQLDQYMMLFKEMAQRSRGIRRLGSAALDLAYVACGRFDLFYEYALQPWDVAAGILLVREAGGRITDLHGRHFPIPNHQIVASNTLIHELFTDISSPIFNRI